jgi:endoglycosylceramidase
MRRTSRIPTYAWALRTFGGMGRAKAGLYGTTVWSGEWGWFGDPSGAAPKVRRYVAQEDAYLWGGAWWDWKQSCGDPHQFSDGERHDTG